MEWTIVRTIIELRTNSSDLKVIPGQQLSFVDLDDFNQAL
jgi:hypothetical protein